MPVPIILKVFTIFCNIGGKWIAPFLMPLINPICWTVLVLSVFLPILYSGPAWMNKDEKGQQDAGKAFGFAFLFYYIIVLVSACSVMQAACAGANVVSI